MPRGKEFCPFENDYFPVAEFKMVRGTRVHNVEPLHRATDGVLVHKEDSELFPVSEMVFLSAEEEAEDR